MGMFDLGNNVKVEEEQDKLGGGGVLDSNVYDFDIKLAYLTKSAGGAMAVNLVLAGAGGVTLKQQIYISSGDIKGNKFTYTDTKSGEERPLPGYSQINSLCVLAVNKDLKDIDPEDKMINIYDFNLKKETLKQVPALTELLNEKITIGVLKVIEDKKVKNEQTGKYEANGETREVNTMAKCFRTEGRLTSSEIAAELTEGDFVNKWLEKNQGAIVDKSTKVAEVTGLSGVPTQTAASNNTPETTKSLFPKK